jgi:hypothetical protein
LRGYNAGQNLASIAQHGRSGFIAGRFDAQDFHAGSQMLVPLHKSQSIVLHTSSLRDRYDDLANLLV